jgi:shikimate dehydrogenase
MTADRIPTGPVRLAVVGSPVSHSLSPVLHSAAYPELGLTDWSYGAVECGEAAFEGWFAGLGPQWRGLSLTMPLKRVVLPLLARISPLARAVGAVNTVTWDDRRRPVGDNTDVHGIVEALRSTGVDRVVDRAGSACVLGAGATAASAVAALAELGCAEVVLLVRSPDRAGTALAVADRLGIRVVLDALDQVRRPLTADVVISTLPAGAAAGWSQALTPTLTQTLSGGRPTGVLLDVTYHPWPTPAVEAWTAAGGIAVGGFEMLLHQAAAQVTLMTGRPAPIEAMRIAGEKALSGRG